MGYGAALRWQEPPVAAEPRTIDLRVMTFNLRYASEQPPNAWPVRRPVLKSAVLEAQPDLIGTQEGLYAQLRDLAQDLPDYDWIGEGREGGSGGEFMAIFYRRARLEPRAYGHLWLSDTPSVVGSKTWGNRLPRMVTWVRFRDKASGVEFYHWNTHFDHQSQPAREKSAELLLKEIRGRNRVLPVVVTGDFNHPQGGIVHQTLLHPLEGALNLADAWDVARERLGDQIGTFHGFTGSTDNPSRIDWILISPEFECDTIAVQTYHENGQFPSDHFPVLAELRLTSPPVEP